MFCLKQTDDWNPRSLKSFQTFPRQASSAGSSSAASDEDGGSDGRRGSDAFSPASHSHSKSSIVDDRSPSGAAGADPGAFHTQSRSLGNPSQFRYANGGGVPPHPALVISQTNPFFRCCCCLSAFHLSWIFWRNDKILSQRQGVDLGGARGWSQGEGINWLLSPFETLSGGHARRNSRKLAN